MATCQSSHTSDQTQENTVNQLIDDREKRERRLILIGKSGHGKSSTGNSTCGYKVFSTSSSTSSHTKQSRLGYRTFDDIELMVCDTPGLFDTTNDLNLIKSEFGRAVQMTSPGSHAFLIHFKIGNRFTDEEQRTIQYIQEIFGEDAHRYCILVLTGEDTLFHDVETIEHYLENAAPGLKQLLAQCHNRYIAFNNRTQQQSLIDDKLRQLLKIIDVMLLNNQTRYYTNQQFQRAEQIFQQCERQKMVIEMRERETQKQALHQEICHEFEMRDKNIEKEKQELIQMVKELRRQARDETAQQRSAAFEIFCTTLPAVIGAAAKMVTTVLQKNQEQNIFPNMNSLRRPLSDENFLRANRSTISRPRPHYVSSVDEHHRQDRFISTHRNTYFMDRLTNDIPHKTDSDSDSNDN